MLGPSRIVKATQMDGEGNCCHEIQYKKAHKRLMVGAHHFVLFVGFELEWLLVRESVEKEYA
jgi:hypothetical protein